MTYLIKLKIGEMPSLSWNLDGATYREAWIESLAIFGHDADYASKVFGTVRYTWA